LRPLVNGCVFSMLTSPWLETRTRFKEDCDFGIP